MKKITFVFSALVVGIIVLISNTAHASKWVVNVQNFSFSPSNLLNVTVGDTVRWVWINGSHTTTSTTIPAGAASWNHPITSSNTFYEYHVTKAGNYSYKCTPHQSMGMVGSFTATAPAPTLVSIAPNQTVQGDTFLATITGSNTNFNGSPSVSLSFSNNAGEIINATSVMVISPTVLDAQFTIPGTASAGLWDVNVNTLVLNNGFTVIEVVPAIILLEPNFAHQGEQVSSLITAVDSRFTKSNPSVSLSFTGNPSEVIDASSVNVLNDTQLEAVFDIPAFASVGSWDVHVDEMILLQGFTVNLFTGINDPVETLVRIYPNPADGLFFIENADGADVTLFNSQGKNIVAQKITSKKQAIDISHLSPGIYILRISAGESVSTSRIIKK